MIQTKSKISNFISAKKGTLSKSLTLLSAVALNFSIGLSVLAPITAKASVEEESSHERHHHIETEIYKDPEGFVRSEFSETADIHWGVSEASDGFKTGYLRLTPKNFDKSKGKTLLMIHGYSKDGTYWLDFTKATKLLELGYQVLLPDLMVRGRTLDLNFPLDKKEIGSHQKDNKPF